MEIERKFLVKKLPEKLGDAHEISQGYISLDPEVRIRHKDNKFFLTAKSDDFLSRDEQELEISRVFYEILSSLIQNYLIEKTRYEIPLSDGNLAELDIYHGNLSGLITVEVEFPSEFLAENFEVPEWFGEDVTFDKKYKNKNLSKLENLSTLINNSNKKKLKK